jgi:rod shape determining protein RodA
MSAVGAVGAAAMRPSTLPSLARRRASTRKLDVVLLGATIALVGMGTLVVQSATRSMEGVDAGAFLVRQVGFIVLGALALIATAAVPVRRLRALAPLAWVACLVLLLAVLSPLGTVVNGARSWFDLGPVQLQPAELAKVATIATLAAYVNAARGPFGARHLMVCLVIVGAPAVLILGQPDLGSVLVFGAVALGVLLVAGAKPRHFVVLAVLGGLVITAAFATGAIEGYQRDRLTSFAGEGGGNDQARYNLDQAKTAIGAGGLTGSGLFQGTQTRGRYVPEQQTDFIFTVVGEELGFFGAASLLLLFGLLCWRVWRTAWVARGTFGALVCVGVLAMLLFQVFENVGMAMGIMPITGLPLPFVSYGGSSLVSTLAAIGLVLNVHRAAAH